MPCRKNHFPFYSTLSVWWEKINYQLMGMNEVSIHMKYAWSVWIALSSMLNKSFYTEKNVIKLYLWMSHWKKVWNHLYAVFGFWVARFETKIQLIIKMSKKIDLWCCQLMLCNYHFHHRLCRWLILTVSIP